MYAAHDMCKKTDHGHLRFVIHLWLSPPERWIRCGKRMGTSGDAGTTALRRRLDHDERIDAVTGVRRLGAVLLAMPLAVGGMVLGVTEPAHAATGITAPGVA